MICSESKLLYNFLKPSQLLREENFDTKQRKAIENVLKRRLALIQGPPGTGKTFVGSRIIKMLLTAKRKYSVFSWPIFIVCFTNHTLDQFLEKILEYTKMVLRLGGRSKNDKLKK